MGIGRRAFTTGLACLAWAAPAHGSDIEHLGTVAMTGEFAEGGRLVGDTFFATSDAGGFIALDVSDPVHPELLARVRTPHMFENEDVATDGRILLLSQGSAFVYPQRAVTRPVLGTGPDGSFLHVYDVSDPRAPELLATLPGAGDHTMTCLLDCTWAYGASGNVVDLRNPARPVLQERLWTTAVGLPDANPAHDLTEIEPGILLSASTPMLLIDARDPLNPKPLASSPAGVYDTFHNNAWPRTGSLVLSASEAYINPRCETRDAGAQVDPSIDSAVRSWDATKWRESGEFTPLADYRLDNDGAEDPAVSQQGLGGCSAHWFDAHPRFRDGGLIVAASYGHGTKFVRVGPDGGFAEVDHYLPPGVMSIAAYWITNRIVYVVDAHRGIEILRYDGDVKPPKSRARPRRGWATENAPTRAEIARIARRAGPAAALILRYCMLRGYA